MNEINLSKRYENGHHLVNGQLYKISKKHVFCEPNEIVEYFKDKYPILLEAEGGVYSLYNDKRHVINTKCYIDLKLISELFVENIFIKHKSELINVWSRDVHIEFNLDQEESTKEFEDGYLIMHGILCKPLDESVVCTIKETIEFFKSKMIRVKTCDCHWYYLLSDRKNTIDDDGSIVEIDTISDKIESMSGWYNNRWEYIWKKESHLIKNLSGKFEIRFD